MGSKLEEFLKKNFVISVRGEVSSSVNGIKSKVKIACNNYYSIFEIKLTLESVYFCVVLNHLDVFVVYCLKGSTS